MSKPKRARRPDARPDEILDAALKVFAEKGFAVARVEDVAAAAGLSKGAVYLYFDSKEALFEALVRRFAQSVVAGAAERVALLAAADPEVALRTALRFIVALMADPALSAAPRLVLAEAQRFPAIARLYRKEVIAVGQRVLGGLIARGTELGAFRAAPAEAALRVVMGPMLAHLFLTHIFVDPEAPPLDPDLIATQIADILILGLKPREPAPERTAT